MCKASPAQDGDAGASPDPDRHPESRTRGAEPLRRRIDAKPRGRRSRGDKAGSRARVAEAPGSPKERGAGPSALPATQRPPGGGQSNPRLSRRLQTRSHDGSRPPARSYHRSPKLPGPLPAPRPGWVPSARSPQPSVSPARQQRLSVLKEIELFFPHFGRFSAVCRKARGFPALLFFAGKARGAFHTRPKCC